jgi:hypothetical protein
MTSTAAPAWVTRQWRALTVTSSMHTPAAPVLPSTTSPPGASGTSKGKDPYDPVSTQSRTGPAMPSPGGSSTVASRALALGQETSIRCVSTPSHRRGRRPSCVTP